MLFCGTQPAGLTRRLVFLCSEPGLGEWLNGLGEVTAVYASHVDGREIRAESIGLLGRADQPDLLHFGNDGMSELFVPVNCIDHLVVYAREKE